MKDETLKRYYCKKTYYNNFSKGFYYYIWIVNNNGSNYIMNWLNDDGYNVNTICIASNSEIDTNFSDYFILAEIHDRKLKLEKIRLS